MAQYSTVSCSFYRTQQFCSQASIEAGRVTVDGKAVKSGHVLRDGQRIVKPLAGASDDSLKKASDSNHSSLFSLVHMTQEIS